MIRFFKIPMKLPSLNEYISANRANKHKGAKFKREVEDSIMFAIKYAVNRGNLAPLENPVDIVIEYYEKTKRRDTDNIQSSQKFILDALVKYGILHDDSRRYVKNIYHKVIDSDRDVAIVYLLPPDICQLKIRTAQEDAP